MNVALIYEKFTRGGGLEHYTQNLAKAFRDHGHELHLVTSKVDEALRDLTPNWVVLPRNKLSSLWRLWSFDRMAAKTVRNLPVDLSIGFGRTTVHDLHRAGGGCHRLYSRLLPFWKRFSPKNLLELHLERKLYTGGGTKRFVVNSAQVSRQLHEHYQVPMEAMTVIHTAVDTERFQPAPHRAALRLRLCDQNGTNPDKPILLFVSMGHRRKGLDTLLQALTRHSEAQLWIAGPPLGRYTDQIKRLGLGTRVHYMGLVEDLRTLYQAADWFVHPTLYDACANTVLQSMASGLPGLISRADGAIDHIRDGENGFLIEPGDAMKLAGKLRICLALPESRRLEIGARARETVLPLTWELHVRQWEDLMKEKGIGIKHSFQIKSGRSFDRPL